MNSITSQAQTKPSTEIPCRPATINEAVDAVMRCFTIKERRRHLAFFRERQGDGFADQVEATVLEKWKK